MHCWGADRPDAGEPAGRLPAVGRARRSGAAPGRAAGGLDRPGDGRRRRGRRARAQPHLVRQPRRAPGAAAPRHPARRDGAQPRAAAALEGRAARRRLRALVLLRADRARGGRRDHRGLGGDAARRPRVLPGDRPGAGRGDLQRHRHRRVPARPAAPTCSSATGSTRSCRRSSSSAGSRARRGSRTCSRRRSTFDPHAQLVLCAGAPDTPEIGAEIERHVERLRTERGNVIWLDRMLPKPRGDPAPQPRDRLRLPVDLRAARDRQPRGDGLRGGGRRDRDGRHPRGRRGRRHGTARPVRAAPGRLAGAARPDGLRRRHRRLASTSCCATRTGRARWAAPAGSA